jgi:uncharacterized membrane protein (UPF0127 family)
VTRARPALAVAAGVVFVALLALVVWRVADASTGTTSSAAAPRGLRDVSYARAPFEGLTAGAIRVGDRRMSVVIADSDSERIQGLRGRRDAAPYDGMLFVFPSNDTSVGFTMAGVRGPLDIAFYSVTGALVDRFVMKPCNGTEQMCPGYRARRGFRYALETAAGDVPTGRLVVK